MNHSQRRALLVFILVTLIAVFTAQPVCAQTWEPLDREATIREAQHVTSQIYPDADVVQLNERRWVRYRQDGTYIEWHEAYVKILTEKGRRRFQTISSFFTIPYNTTMVTLVEIIKPDGSAVRIDGEKKSREMVRQTQMQSNIFNPNDRVLQVNIPELDRGDIVHFIIFDDFTKARMPGSWSDFVSFEGIDPIVRSDFTVVAPAALPLKSIALKGEIPGTVTYSEQAIDVGLVHTWTARDVPRAFEEPDMPPLYTQAQRLLVSTIPDWEEVSRWYWRLSEPRIEQTSPKMKQAVARLVDGVEDPMGRIRNLFMWVSQEIRYLGITVEEEAPGYEPHDVVMTFDRRAGVCRDKAALLVAMLRLAGFEAFPVLIMNGPKKDPEVPQPFFNHAISCVRMGQGDYLLMDSTDENTKDLFPAYLSNQSYLVATPEGDTLRTSPTVPAEENMMHLDTRGYLDEKGALHATATLDFEGINDTIYRGYFSRLNPVQRHRYFEGVLKRVAPGAFLDHLEITPENLLDTSRSLRAVLHYTMDNLPVSAEAVTMLPLVHLGERIGVVNFLAQKMGLRQRRFPYVTEIACGLRETIQLHLPQNLGTLESLPRFEGVDTPHATWNRSLAIHGTLLDYENTFFLHLPEYSPREYRDLKELFAQIDSADRMMPIFTRGAKGKGSSENAWYAGYNPDAVILRDETRVDVIDQHTWKETRHRKILVRTYAGKKIFSDVRIPYNPAWEEVAVERAIVLSPSGQAKEIQEQELNVMDQEWVGAAPRYPAGKILVMSLPGVVDGSIVEYTLVHTKKNRTGFFLSADFHETDPLEHKTLTVMVPEHTPVRISSSDVGFGLIGPGMTSHEQVIETLQDQAAVKKTTVFRARNVPPTRKEEHLPPLYTFGPAVMASSMNLEDYARMARERLVEAASRQTRTGEVCRQVLEGISDDLEKIRVLRDFVARNIRAVDIDFSKLPLESISPADRTLGDGYGHSADRAVVLSALLDHAGFEPQFVLVPDIPPEKGLVSIVEDYPAHDWFKTVLVMVHTSAGDIFLGDTDQYAAVGTTAHDGWPGLFLDSGTIRTIRASSTAMRDGTEDHYTLHLSASGDVMLTKQRRFFGMEYARFHKTISEKTPQERDRHFQELVFSLAKDAEPEGNYFTDYDSYPGVEEYTVRIASFAPRQDQYLSLELPGLKQVIRGAEADTRNNPLVRERALRERVMVEVSFPQGVSSVAVLPSEHISMGLATSGMLTQQTSLNHLVEGPGKTTIPDSLVLMREIELSPGVVMPGDYGDLLELQRILMHPGNRMLLLNMNR
ncbi:MAG TPA: DUF3857 domain-containing protein [Deltaproteobacteria bacterium]|nr:DUF3857 domain-containing protein [Deltaproteobacteria bacterium]